MTNQEATNLQALRKGDSVEVGGISMIIAATGRYGPHFVAVATEDGLGVDWDVPCSGEEFGGEEVLCADLTTGRHYWVCVRCRGVVTPRGTADA